MYMYIAMIYFLFEKCREHRTLYDTCGKSKKYKREMTHTKEFHTWLKEEVDKKEECSQQLLSLAKGPQ